MDMRFGTWNVRSLYRSGSLKTVAGELGKYKIDLVGVQEVRWDKGGTERAEDCTFFYGAGNEDHQLGTGFFVHKRIVSAVRRVEFVTDRMSYIILRGRWCNIIVQFRRLILCNSLRLKMAYLPNIRKHALQYCQ
jgi:exonuclease III